MLIRLRIPPGIGVVTLAHWLTSSFVANNLPRTHRVAQSAPPKQAHPVPDSFWFYLDRRSPDANGKTVKVLRAVSFPEKEYVTKCSDDINNADVQAPGRISVLQVRDDDVELKLEAVLDHSGAAVGEWLFVQPQYLGLF